MNDNDLEQISLDDVRKLPPMERFPLWRPECIPHLSWTNAYSAICAQHKMGNWRHEISPLFISGESGAGKTELLKHYASKFSDCQSGDSASKLVVEVNLSLPANLHSVARSILDGLGYLHHRRMTIGSMTKLFLMNVDSFHPKLLLFDEANCFLITSQSLSI